eukprot:3689213-Pyramimonas_sp.AAC.1
MSVYHGGLALLDSQGFTVPTASGSATRSTNLASPDDAAAPGAGNGNPLVNDGAQMLQLGAHVHLTGVQRCRLDERRRRQATHCTRGCATGP